MNNEGQTWYCPECGKRSNKPMTKKDCYCKYYDRVFLVAFAVMFIVLAIACSR